MRIIIDTREQRPYRFPDGVETVRQALVAGDYSVEGLEGEIAVERKSLADAYGTFGRGRARFVRELDRLAQVRYAAVVVEADLATALFLPPARSRLSPRSFNRSWIAWSVRTGVHFLFCGSRELAERETFLLLQRAWMDRVGRKVVLLDAAEPMGAGSGGVE